MGEDVISFIEKNKIFVEKLIAEGMSSENEEEKIEKLYDAAAFAAHNVSGFMCNSEIENELVRISQKYSVPIDFDFKPNTFLHVMTETYVTGGHTRVVERWIKNSPDSQVHSLVLTKNTTVERLPEVLVKNVADKNGELVIFDDADSYVQKALNLRKLASNYEYVILHVHMFDVIPIIAFANLEFKRPVIFYNHADHVFWIGVSISDLIVNLRGYSSTYNEKNRQCFNNTVLPLPIPKGQNLNIDVDESIESNESIKEQLGFKKDSQVIVTMACGYKYIPFFEYDFIKTAKKILAKNKNAVLLAIGPNPEAKMWEKAYRETNGRLKAIGEVENKVVQKYLKIADLGLDSFPISSFVALLEIARYNIPCLSLLTPLNDFDTFRDSGICCKNQDELVDLACEYLKNKDKYENKLIDILENKHFEQGFKEQLISLYKEFPSSHQLHLFETDKDRQITELETFVAANHLAINKIKQQKKYMFKIPYIFEVYKRRSQTANMTCLLLLGKELILRTRKTYC